MKLDKWKCPECGVVFENTKPLEHGTMTFSFYPNRPKPAKVCNGKLEKIE